MCASLYLCANVCLAVCVLTLSTSVGMSVTEKSVCFCWGDECYIMLLLQVYSMSLFFPKKILIFFVPGKSWVEEST